METKLSLKHSNFVWPLKNIYQSMSSLLVQCYFQHIAYGSKNEKLCCILLTFIIKKKSKMYLWHKIYSNHYLYFVIYLILIISVITNNKRIIEKEKAITQRTIEQTMDLSDSSQLYLLKQNNNEKAHLLNLFFSNEPSKFSMRRFTQRYRENQKKRNSVSFMSSFLVLDL